MRSFYSNAILKISILLNLLKIGERGKINLEGIFKLYGKFGFKSWLHYYTLSIHGDFDTKS